MLESFAALTIPGFFSPEESAQLREKIEIEPLVGGKASAGLWGSDLKSNMQVEAAALRPEGAKIVNQLFLSEAVSKWAYPRSANHPTFSVYRDGDH